ncbi:MAG: SH3 domain-containing protein [Ruminococcus sp.]|nr:SH3 domain-containing protein [Ruminococcus sp.]
MLKKALCTLSILMVALSLCACSSSGDVDITFVRKTTTTTTVATVEEDTSEADEEEATTEEATEEATEEEADEETVQYTADQDVNVREEPDYNSTILGTLTAGEAVGVYTIENGWAIIDYDGDWGYVSSDYLTLVSE